MRSRLKDRYIVEKVDEKFVQELREIAGRNHAVSGFPPSTRRLTKAIRRHSLWAKLKEDISITPLEDDTK